MIGTLSRDVEQAKETIESNLRAIQRMRARDHTDYDNRHKAAEEKLAQHFAVLSDHQQHFESIGTVTTMLVENLNMQMEAELADLLDRKLISLYGYNNPTGANQKFDAVGASAQVKGHAPKTRQMISPSLLDTLRDTQIMAVQSDTDEQTELNFPKISTAGTQQRMFDTSTGPFLSTGLRGETNTAETQMRQARVGVID